MVLLSSSPSFPPFQWRYVLVKSLMEACLSFSWASLCLWWLDYGSLEVAFPQILDPSLSISVSKCRVGTTITNLAVRRRWKLKRKTKPKKSLVFPSQSLFLKDLFISKNKVALNHFYGSQRQIHVFILEWFIFR